MISQSIAALVDYAVRSELIDESDRRYMLNAIAEELGNIDFTEARVIHTVPLCEILGALSDYAEEAGVIKDGGTHARDLFDTRLMGRLTPPPSVVIRRFFEEYKTSPVSATEYFYKLCKSSNYIREDRIARDIKWLYPCEFGELEITVNLAKPEKDPRDIQKAREKRATDYPKCPLCPENEGFAGGASKSARQNLRLIPIELGGERWFFQYSPYVYYQEHCIALSEGHVPMRTDGSTFLRMLDFLDIFPHYFIGSNADLAIVGGSILSHEHMQGGCHCFAMERAPIEEKLCFSGYEHVRAGIVKWPMSVIRLASDDREAILSLSERILDAWRVYTDEEAFIYSESCGEPHNAVTPIARIRGGRYEMDLVLRNNMTTSEHPLGVYHPHAEHHNIKKENIGLIEAMGLAVLPARLALEMELMSACILKGEDLSSYPQTAKHREWFLRFADKYEFLPENIENILRAEIGKTFLSVLSDAGVFRRTAQGRSAFLKFIDAVNEK